MRELFVIAHNIRSTHNVGSLLRTAEGLGVKKVYLTGYTPYPKQVEDTRLPHIADKLTLQIHKTALDAESTQAWEYREDLLGLLNDMEKQGVVIAALEQSDKAVELAKYNAPDKIALLLGEEVNGISQELLDTIALQIFIPMFGKKESFNVIQAAAMALYEFRFH